jgi:signal transduction histidine kinase
LGGLAWATILALRLEEADLTARREKDRSRDLRLAVRRLDARVQSTISRETSRGPHEYYAVVSRETILYGDRRPAVAGRVTHLSPLVTTTFEPWLLGHFQVSPTSEWSSPQAEAERWTDLPGYNPPAGLSVAASTLAALRRTLTPHQLGHLLAEARERDNRYLHLALGDQPRGADFVRRRKQFEQLLRRPPELCDRRDLELILTAQLPVQQDWPDDNDQSCPAGDSEPDSPDGDVPIITSELTALWLALDGGPLPYLTFARTVSSVEGDTFYQGFVVDWAMLRDLLLEEINDLFPGASLVPAGSEPADDPETLMTYVPVRLEVSDCLMPTPVAGWHPGHTGLLVAWVAALVVLIAAGVGVKGLLTLAERRSQFAYAVSHELRTPLTTFRLYTDMLVDGLVPEDSRDEYLKTLNTESQRLTQLVGGVLEYSQLEHHALQPTFEDVTVKDLLDTARERFEPRCRDADRQLVIQANDLAGLACRTDPELALQIVGTLIDNACKYAREAQDRRIILSADSAASDRLRLEVRDFGPGVPRRQRRRIFKPFHRGQREDAPSHGIGLGLALANRWANLLGGKLELICDHRAQPGARFRLTLPSQPSHKRV